MAITVTGSPIKTREGVFVNILAAGNPLIYQITADAGETSIQIQVQNQAGTEVLGTLPVLPITSAGTLDFDIAFILRNQLSNNDNVDNARTWTSVQIGKSISFRIEYRVGGVGAYALLGGYYASNSAMQIGSAFGATLAEYLPLMTGTTVDFTGKFMTLFENHVLFWYSSVNEPTLSSQTSIFQPQIGFAVSEADEANITILRSLSIGSTTTSSNNVISVTAGVTVSNLPNAILAFGVHSIAVTAGTNNGTGGLQSSAYDALTFTPRRVCQNPTAVRWLNSLGIWETWVFEGNSPYEIETSNGNEYGIYNPDLSIATETSRILSKRVTKSVSLSTDNLLLDQVRAISELYYSPNVLIYVGEYADGIAFDEWQGAIVDTGSFAVEDTNNKRHKISFDLRLADIQTISN